MIGSDDRDVIPVELANGRTALVEIVGGGGQEKVAARRPKLAQAVQDLKDISVGIVQAFEDLQVTKTTIEFGVSFGIESGQLSVLLAKASADANLTVTIELGDSAERANRTVS